MRLPAPGCLFLDKVLYLGLIGDYHFIFQVEDGNPHVVWSASEDGTFRQHDFREGVLCPPSGSGNQDCRNILVSAPLS